jgi:histidine triad (HIT) family protein
MDDCLFCRIAKGDAPAKLLFKNDDAVVFHDIAPRAPVHLLVIPRRHIASLSTADEKDHELLGKLLLTAAKAAEQCGLYPGGYRVVTNCGAGAGQSVFHLHFHVLGGRPLGWPPG